MPIPEIKIINPAASRVILSDNEYKNFVYSGLSEALEILNSKILIFGKPFAKKGRRMAVALATGNDINEARLRADNCASKINIYSLE